LSDVITKRRFTDSTDISWFIVDSTSTHSESCITETTYVSLLSALLASHIFGQHWLWSISYLFYHLILNKSQSALVLTARKNHYTYARAEI